MLPNQIIMNKKHIITSIAIILIAGLIWAFDKAPISNGVKMKTPLQTPVPSELVDSEGEAVNFEDFKGKIVFINNWASWCPPCVAEMPTIEELKGKMPSEEVVFVMVSYDRNPRTGIKWMKNKKIDLPVYFPGQKFPRQFITEAIPATFVLDREGKVLHTYLGMANYSSEAFIAQMKEWIDL